MSGNIGNTNTTNSRRQRKSSDAIFVLEISDVYLPWAMRYNHKDTVQRKQRLSHTYGESASTYYTKMIYLHVHGILSRVHATNNT